MKLIFIKPVFSLPAVVKTKKFTDPALFGDNTKYILLLLLFHIDQYYINIYIVVLGSYYLLACTIDYNNYCDISWNCIKHF